ncbi:MAG: DUF2167 domain-containing protein [Bacteroidota bacterium]
MKKHLSLFSVLFILFSFFSQTAKAMEEDSASIVTDDTTAYQLLNYDTVGTIPIGLGLAKFSIPNGFKFLNAIQSQYVLSSLWGNPPNESTLGMIFPSEAGNVVPVTWAIQISYEEDGHVKDDDAKDIDYEDLLKDMQKQIEEVNPERKKAGYPTYELAGWASAPYYDEKEKKLHWAKRILFEGDSAETLNYNIRILGRKGVMVLNAIGEMNQLAEIKAQINPILANINFDEGNRYADFDEGIDKTAAYGIAGLITGGVLLKSGLFAKIGILLLKFLKPILVGGGLLIAGLVKYFTKKKNDEELPA